MNKKENDFPSSLATFWNIIEICKIDTFQRNLSKIFPIQLNIYLFPKILQQAQTVMLRWNIFQYLKNILRQYFNRNKVLKIFLTYLCNILCYVDFFLLRDRMQIDLKFYFISIHSLLTQEKKNNTSIIKLFSTLPNGTANKRRVCDVYSPDARISFWNTIVLQDRACFAVALIAWIPQALFGTVTSLSHAMRALSEPGATAFLATCR